MNASRFISLVHTQALMKLKSQANNLVLSYLWWVLEPLLYVLLFYFVFKYVLYRGGENFLTFLMVGKISFLWFSKAVTSGANSLIENKGLLMQRDMPKAMFPLVNCQEAFYKQQIAFVVLFVVLIVNGFSASFHWLNLIPIILLQYLLTIGVAAFFSVFVTIAQDFRMVIQLFMLGLMFTSGIFWDVNLIQDPNLKDMLLLLNPLAALIQGYREVLMWQGVLEFKYMLSITCWALLAIILGTFLLTKNSNYLTRKLL